MSIRASKALRFWLSFGELAKLEKRLELVGAGYRFSSLMALASKRPAGSWFRPQAASVKFAVLAGQVPKGSRTNPELAAVRPDTGSVVPAVTARVVAGSR